MGWCVKRISAWPGPRWSSPCIAMRQCLAGPMPDTSLNYRAAVDTELMRLGQLRYEPLVSLLIQLRKPQLSKRPD